MSRDPEVHSVDKSPEPSEGDDTPPPPYEPVSTPPQDCVCPRRPRDGQDDAGTPATTNDRDTPGTGINGATMAKIAGGVALVGIAAPVLVTAGAALVLPAIGFTSGGVAGGSIAALMQSVFYGASTGGLFSVFQAAGATVVAPAAIEVVGALGAAAAGAGAIAAGSSGDGSRGPGIENEQGNATDGGVQCPCKKCVCEEDCECACRRRQRGGHA